MSTRSSLQVKEDSSKNNDHHLPADSLVDKSVLEASLKKYLPTFYGLIVLKVGESTRADHLVQTFCNMVRNKFPSYKGSTSLFTWMLWNLRALLQEYNESTLEDNSLQSPATLSASGGIAAQVPGLDGITELENSIISKLIYMNQTQAQVAKDFNIPLSDIRVMTREALLKLRTES